MGKRFFVAADVPQFKAALGAFKEREILGKHDVKVSACKKARRIELSADRLWTVYVVCREFGWNAKSFLQEWKAM